jgi:hypothetical protein
MPEKSKQVSTPMSKHGYEIKVFRVIDDDPDSSDRIAEIRDILVHLLILARKKGRPQKKSDHALGANG